MRFAEFLRTTVLLSAAAATALAAVTIAAASSSGDDLIVPVAAAWWVAAALIGGWLGRRAATSPPIASLLASARTQASLPELQQPGRIVINRLWPLLVSTIGAGALAFVAPQVPAVAVGFAIIPALAWRRQASAVTAIEERDGARFYIERTSPLRPMRLVRTPGFRSNLYELTETGARPGVTPRA